MSEATPSSQPGSANPKASYFPQLDGLRGLAVLAVLYHHYVPQAYHAGVRWGDLGVNAFFVLSGFLITGILLRCRDHVDSGLQSTLITARQFYMRRLIRIFPLFYLVLAAMFVLDASGVRDNVGWHAAYLSNVFFAIEGKFEGQAVPFWSLAVEEQFYLVWPWLILLCPRRVILPGIIATILLGPLVRGFQVSQGASWVAVRVLTPGCGDLLGAGALLAYLWYRGLSDHPRFRRACWICLIAGLLGFVLIKLVLEPLDPAFDMVVKGVCVSAFCFAVVHFVALGVPGWVGKTLGSAVLTYIGRISYGIYVLHTIAPLLVNRYLSHHIWKVLEAMGIESETSLSVATRSLQFIVAILLATLTWYAFEKPINSLKKHFPYKVRKNASESSTKVAGSTA